MELVISNEAFLDLMFALRLVRGFRFPGALRGALGLAVVSFGD